MRRRGVAPAGGPRPHVPPPPPSEWEAAVAGLQESVAGALGGVAGEAREQWGRLLETPAAVELLERASELEHEISLTLTLTLSLTLTLTLTLTS